MRYQEEYKRWLRKATDAEMQVELQAISDDAQAQRDRFESELAFGTAGLRGVLGAGRNRMNIYTVRRTTQGLAEYVLARYGEGSVAIAYDSRHKSELFARECAAVLAGNGVTALLYDRLMPTPMLSFAVRDLGARAGIMITASHNPAQYNGYKVYGPDGCQMTLEDTETVSARIGELDYFDGIERLDFEEGIKRSLIKFIDKMTIERYYAAVRAQRLNVGICSRYPIKVLYSPLNGAGNEAVRHILDEIGVRGLTVVPEQELPDGDFPTCPYPNPETKEALALGLAMCETDRPDLFIATDPDADRVGVALKDGDGYRILTGNEVGVLLLHYIMQARTENKSMPARPVAVRSVVSTALADDIAREGGVEMVTVLTGFKFIGEQILLLEQQNEEERFIFGFEESCGYLAGSYVRDKDAVLACMLLCEMTSWCRMKNIPPTVLLDRIYQKFGYYRNGVVNLEFPGPDGIAEMNALMDGLFREPPQALSGHTITSVSDFRRSIRVSLTLGVETPIQLPSADMIGFRLETGATVLVRPSGTEPKMKVYITAKESNPAASETLVAELAAAMKALLQNGKK